MYVLAVYGLVFGIMLPAVVGNWWYKSIQYTGDAVLIKTTKLFEVKMSCQKLSFVRSKKAGMGARPGFAYSPGNRVDNF